MNAGYRRIGLPGGRIGRSQDEQDQQEGRREDEQEEDEQDEQDGRQGEDQDPQDQQEEGSQILLRIKSPPCPLIRGSVEPGKGPSNERGDSSENIEYGSLEAEYRLTDDVFLRLSGVLWGSLIFL